MSHVTRLLIYTRPDWDTRRGGDSIQIMETVRVLREQGYQVTITSSLNESLASYQAAVIFNLTLPEQAYWQYRQIKRASIPFVVFSVFWDLDSLPLSRSRKDSLKRWFIPNWVKVLLRSARYLKKNKMVRFDLLKLRSRKSMINEIVDHAAMIFPNSRAEQEHLIQYMGRNDEGDLPFKIIYNGINKELIKGHEQTELASHTLPKRFICCIGAIGPRKNQLRLIEASNLTGIPLVLVGQASASDWRYERDARKMAGSQVTFIPHLPQRDIFTVMKKSSGHIQPSLIETPGLASMEAYALGQEIAVSDTSPVREYFGHRALYCSPQDVKSIETCLIQLFEGKANKNNSNQANEFIDKYDWNQVLKPIGESLRDGVEGGFF
ncbi:glycosyltransferase family 4 protein [Paenibacillus albicereus]|uniref:Glycosyltransferase family 4 protein n=1 Tax=Paenibacillus albicereus TaxID=2726185 RepID=A0A6H2H2G7_9BACL|nr:glycosyltransferase [Paenibacillus albicereus]QJC53871.1 glycosyltransferase family 4 protein [Paenibacillus albicereus]